MTAIQHLEKIVREATNMQALPGSALRLTTLLASDDWLISDIVDTISHDQALTGRLLCLANSAASGAVSEIGTVSDAVMRVGTGPVLSLAMATAVGDELGGAVETFGASEGVLWRHSVASALAVSKIASYCSRTPPPETYVAALMHDIGFLVLDRWVHTFPAGPKRDSIASRVGDLDHAILGSLMAAHWSMPEIVQLGITHHHHPTDAPDFNSLMVANFVAVGDCVAQRIGAGFGPDANKLSLDTTTVLELTRTKFQDLCKETKDDLDEFLEVHS